MKKYRARSWNNQIEVVEVERETGSSVWIKGRRSKKQTLEGDSYFDTFIEAKNYMLDIAERRVNLMRARWERAKAYYGNVKGLKEL